MARLIQERWEGVGFAVTKEQMARANADGTPEVDAEGAPVLMDLWTLVVTMDTPMQRHAIAIPFDEEARENLLRQFNRGVIIAPAIPGSGIIQ